MFSYFLVNPLLHGATWLAPDNIYSLQKNSAETVTYVQIGAHYNRFLIKLVVSSDTGKILDVDSVNWLVSSRRLRPFASTTPMRG